MYFLIFRDQSFLEGMNFLFITDSFLKLFFENLGENLFIEGRGRGEGSNPREDVVVKKLRTIARVMFHRHAA